MKHNCPGCGHEWTQFGEAVRIENGVAVGGSPEPEIGYCYYCAWCPPSSSLVIGWRYTKEGWKEVKVLAA